MHEHHRSGRLLRFVAAAGIVAGVVLVPTAAFADSEPYISASPPAPTHHDPIPQVVQTTGAKTSGTLPFTGGDVAGLAAIGAGSALVGTALVRHARRARVAA